jgi:GH24 family phage-related lysozyme (muramidase)
MPLTLKFKQPSVLKQQPIDSSNLSAAQRIAIKGAEQLPIASFRPAEGKHLLVTLDRSCPISEVRTDWFVYAPHVAIERKEPQRINAAGLKLLKQYEGLRLEAYQCPAGVWTIGYGSTDNVTRGMKITEAQAEELLKKDLVRFENAVRSLVSVPLSDEQFSALVSFTYNVGIGALRDSTLLRLLNQWQYVDAASEFLRWNKAGLQVLAGLTARRNAERMLFMGNKVI